MDSRIKILFTIPNFKTAGSKYVLLALFKNLRSDIFEPLVCVEKFPETIPDFIPKQNRIVFNFERKGINDCLKFRQLLKENKIDIVHSWDYKSNYWEALACRMAGVKYLYTKKNNSWSKRWWLKSFLSSHIAYDNPEMRKRFFNNKIFSSKINFIPHGVDIEVFKPLPKLERKSFNIGCIGNIGTNKNQIFILKTLIDLPKNIVLHLYGNQDEEYRKTLDHFIRKENLENRVHFHGYLKNEEIPESFRNIDLFVLASFQEGLPVSILEAMACGILVLSSDSGGGAKYMLGDDFIFSLDNTDVLRSKILKMYNMPPEDRSEIINKYLAKVREIHNIEKEIKAYESLYQKLIDA